jgi:hypothetical protein
MDFCSEFPKLESAQKERFQRVVTRLLSGHVLTPGPALRPDPDWRFAERYRELVDAYLRIGGWRLEIDLALRICRALHEAGEQRVRFNKLESLLACILRLAYHEQMHQVREDATCELRVGDVRERMIQAGKAPNQIGKRALYEAFRKLKRHSLVEMDRGFECQDTDKVVVTPLIEKVLAGDQLAQLADRVRAYAASGAATAAAEEPAEEDGEDVPP